MHHRKKTSLKEGTSKIKAGRQKDHEKTYPEKVHANIDIRMSCCKGKPKKSLEF